MIKKNYHPQNDRYSAPTQNIRQTIQRAPRQKKPTQKNTTLHPRNNRNNPHSPLKLYNFFTYSFIHFLYIMNYYGKKKKTSP